MIVLATAVTLFGALSLLNLVLTLGLVRRLRQLSPRIGSAGADLPLPGLRLGELLPLAEQLGQLNRPLLVGFFSLGCTACPEHVAPFRAYAETFPGDAVAILEGGPDADAKYGPELGDGVRLVSNSAEGIPISVAIGLRAWPSFVVVDETGRVRSTALSVNALDPMALGPMAVDAAIHRAGAGAR